MTFRRRSADPAVHASLSRQVAEAIEVVRRNLDGEEVDPETLVSALKLIVTGLPDSASMRVQLANAYLARDSPDDFVRAVEQLERAVEVAEPEQRRDTLDNVWNVWLNRFEAGGKVDDLAKAIKAIRVAATEPQEGHERAERLGILGRMYKSRYELTGDARDMDAALQAMFAAIELVEGTLDQLPYTADIAAVLIARFDRDAVIDDLERGIEILEEVVKLAGEQPALTNWLSNLASALIKRSELTDDRSDAHRAVAIAEQAVRLAPNDPLAQAQQRLNLGTALLNRYRHGGGGLADVNGAIAVSEEALPQVGTGDPVRPILLQSLASAYGIRFKLEGSEEDASRAIAFREAALSVMAPGHPDRPLVLVDLGQGLRLRHARHGEADDLGRGMSLLRDALAEGLEQNLSVALKAARQLCEWSAEQGAWSAAGEAGRAGLDVLARQFRRQLTLGQKKAWLSVEQRLPGKAAVALARSGDLEGAVLALERARTLLLAEAVADTAPLTFAQVRTKSAVLVYLASSSFGGVALAVTGGNVFARDLPDLKEDALMEWVSKFLNAGSRRGAEPDEWQRVLDWTGEWLWKSCMREALEIVPDVAELVLIPCGPLALLPLHVAWTPDPSRPAGRRYALDDALIAYAPSARAFHRARMLRLEALDRPLVTIADPDGVAPLPFAQVEVGAIAALWPHAIALSGAEATNASVAAALPHAGVIHIACHGRADITDPDVGGISLAQGERLSPNGLSTLRLHARLAVLSACETGVPGLKAPDEVAGLPTSLLQVGRGRNSRLIMGGSRRKYGIVDGRVLSRLAHRASAPRSSPSMRPAVAARRDRW